MDHMTDKEKLNQLAEIYKKFRAENPSLRARLPEEVRQIAADLSASGVEAEKIANACDVSMATAYNWMRFKRRENGASAHKRPPGFVIRRPGPISMTKPALALEDVEDGQELMAHTGEHYSGREISLLINGQTVMGDLNDIRKLLGFDAV